MHLQVSRNGIAVSQANSATPRVRTQQIAATDGGDPTTSAAAPKILVGVVADSRHILTHDREVTEDAPD